LIVKTRKNDLPAWRKARCQTVENCWVTADVEDCRVIAALIIVGDSDLGTPRPMAEEIVRAMPRSRLHVIPRAAHLSSVEQPAEFNRVLRQFLAASS
jgi:3-oxoadipate enol-lactonase